MQYLQGLLAHLLVKKQAEVRKSGLLPWLRPDAKSQLSFVYDELGKPNYISAIVLSSQHSPEISQKDLEEGIREEIINKNIPSEWITDLSLIHIYEPTRRRGR